MSNIIDDITAEETEAAHTAPLFDEFTKQLSELKALIFNEPEIDQAKIDLCKSELKTNQYQINSKTIATKLLESQFNVSPISSDKSHDVECQKEPEPA